MPDQPYPVNEAKVFLTAEERIAKVGYDVEADPMGWYKMFMDFDDDKSGEIDIDEMVLMIEKLGLVMKRELIRKMVEAEDEDGSGKIEFDEFVSIMKKAAAEGASAGGMSLAALIKKRANSVDAKWKTERIGEGVKVDGDALSFVGSGFACATLDPYMPGEMRCNKGAIMLEVDTSGPGDVWIGLVGNNFNPEGDHWNQFFFDMKNEKRMIVTAVHSADGKLYLNGAEQNTFSPYGGKPHPKSKAPTPQRFQIEVAKDTDDLDFTLWSPVANAGPDADAFENTGTVKLDQLKHSFAVGVCFTPTHEAGAPAEGVKPTTVRLVGSSIEKTEKRNRRASKELHDEENVQGVNDKPVAAIGANELNG